MHGTRDSLNPVLSINLTITTPDGSKYGTEVPFETLVDQLLRAFLSQWQRPLAEARKSQRYTLRVKDAVSPTLERTTTLREAGLGTRADLAIVPEALDPNDAIGLTIEDGQGTQYDAEMLANTTVGQLAETFLHQRPGTGRVVAEWVLSPNRIKQLSLDASLYDQGVSDRALLRIYRAPTPTEE